MNRLPLSAATAMFEHLTGPVAENPQRLGKQQLDAPLDNLWSTRRGKYRAIYAVDNDRHRISVVAVAHRRDAYRTP
jgi:mRNA interferase RelE/StbE